ncbi:MAG: hypothetical protein NVV63_12560 [Opitutus sp.]|nr:hypothetical protein [Opitutus sp.]
MKITVKYSGNQIEKSFASGANITVSSVIGDRNVQGVLGFGDNVTVSLQGGGELNRDAILRDGDVLEITTRANSKAA